MLAIAWRFCLRDAKDVVSYERQSMINSLTMGNDQGPTVIFAHGWGRDHHDFIPVAEAISPIARSVLIDLPGFGDSPRPEAAWSTKDYASAMIEHIAGITDQPVIWVGHSFGGRVGLRIAVQKPSLLKGLVLVASAGIPIQKSELQKFKAGFRSRKFKKLAAEAKDEQERIALEKQYGSADYVHAREIGMRDIFLATIKEDQSEAARGITTPTHLIYGAKDTETPPEIGKRLANLIKGSHYVECPGLDHISLLDRGRHQIALAIKGMLL